MPRDDEDRTRVMAREELRAAIEDPEPSVIIDGGYIGELAARGYRYVLPRRVWLRPGEQP